MSRHLPKAFGSRQKDHRKRGLFGFKCFGCQASGSVRGVDQADSLIAQHGDCKEPIKIWKGAGPSRLYMGAWLHRRQVEQGQEVMPPIVQQMFLGNSVYDLYRGKTYNGKRPGVGSTLTTPRNYIDSL
jgi:hypothetical protein